MGRAVSADCCLLSAAFQTLHFFRCASLVPMSEQLRCSPQTADKLTDYLICIANSTARQLSGISALLPMKIYDIHPLTRDRMLSLLSFQPLRSLSLRSGSLRSSSFNPLRIRTLVSSEAVSVNPVSKKLSIPPRFPDTGLTDLSYMSIQQPDTDWEMQSVSVFRKQLTPVKTPAGSPSGDLSDGQSGVSQVRFLLSLHSVRNLTSLTML